MKFPNLYFFPQNLYNDWSFLFYIDYVLFSILLQFVADGVFFAELNEVLTRELAEDGYSGVEVRVTPMRTEIIIRATRTQNVLGQFTFEIQLIRSLIFFCSSGLNVLG